MRWLVLFISLLWTSAGMADVIDKKKIEGFIENRSKVAKFPDVAVLVISGNETHILFEKKQNKANRRPVGESSIFEIGSNSKAFTGVAIQLLIQQGKLSLNTKVDQILPDLKMKYEGNNANLEVRHLLFQTSGIPFKSIEKVNLCKSDSNIAFLIDQLNGIDLDFAPGERFSYATVNYDVLGLIIEKLSGVSFQEFIHKNILAPLNMQSTYIPQVGRKQLHYNKATGFKLGFGQSKPFETTAYPCHAPAAYIHSNIEDMAKWVRAVIESKTPNSPLLRAIKASYQSDKSVFPEDYQGSFYGSGWYVSENWQSELSHLGSNPNFSSCVTVRPEKNSAVVALANLNSNHIASICRGIDRYLQVGKFDFASQDEFQNLDSQFTFFFVLSIIGTVIVLFAFAFRIYQIKQNTASLGAIKKPRLLPMVTYCLFLCFITLLLYILPTFLFFNLSWQFVLEWGPFSILPTIIALWFFLFLSISYLYLRKFPHI